jgi:hypothetical protein
MIAKNTNFQGDCCFSFINRLSNGGDGQCRFGAAGNTQCFRVSAEFHDLHGGQSGPRASVSVPRPAFGKHRWAVGGSRLARKKSRYPGGRPLEWFSVIAKKTTGSSASRRHRAAEHRPPQVRKRRASETRRSEVPPRTPTPWPPTVWSIGVRSDSTDFDGARTAFESPPAMKTTDDAETRSSRRHEMPLIGLNDLAVVPARRRICRGVSR